MNFLADNMVFVLIGLLLFISLILAQFRLGTTRGMVGTGPLGTSTVNRFAIIPVTVGVDKRGVVKKAWFSCYRTVSTVTYDGYRYTTSIQYELKKKETFKPRVDYMESLVIY